MPAKVCRILRRFAMFSRHGNPCAANVKLGKAIAGVAIAERGIPGR